MSGENEGTVSESTVEHEHDADFDAGFSGAATETPAPPAEPEKPEPTPAPTPAPEPSAPEFVNLTKEEHERLVSAAGKLDELTGTVNKKFETAFGHVGALRQMIQKLQGETPEGHAVQLDESDFAELKEQYPELADLTLKGLNKVMGKLKGTGGNVDPKVFEEKAGEIRSTVTREVTDMTLDAIVDGDWQQEVNSPKFAEWMKAQTPEVKALAASDKLRDAARLMRLFKAHADAPPPVPTPSPAPTPAPTPSPRQQRTTAAVPPRGDGGHAPAPSEDDEFSAGFNYRRSG
jgi:hypothetical protein